jgi:hypothetical protein
MSGQCVTASPPGKQPCRPWENSGLDASRMNSHRGDLGLWVQTPRMARSQIRWELTKWDASPGLIEVAVLLTSELVTNALQFSLRPPRIGDVPSIRVGLWYVPELAVVEVSDANEKPPEMKVADDESEGGRGLYLVQELSSEWSYYYPRKGWKTVYCVIGSRDTVSAS